ncbi:MAG: Crp/Fnr family transcriptional regulator [Actinomycetota bacterium]|nr:Crp/Fnr family transcriptional regulator [Actinomycetota bacterium]
MPTIRCPVIDLLDPRDRKKILDRSVCRRLSRGEPLYFAGDTSERAHVVRSGVLKLTARNLEGDETILCLATPGEIAGDLSILDGRAQPLDAIAATTVHVLGIDSMTLSEALARNPAATRALARQVGRRTRWILEAMLERTTSEVPARLAGRLLHLAELLGERRGPTIEMNLPLPQRDLGSFAGMCRESACKTLKRFRDEGLLEYRGRKLRILRPDSLERIRCAGRARELEWS